MKTQIWLQILYVAAILLEAEPMLLAVVKLGILALQYLYTEHYRNRKL